MDQADHQFVNVRDKSARMELEFRQFLSFAVEQKETDIYALWFIYTRKPSVKKWTDILL